MAQCFAVMPVNGVKGENSSQLFFSWTSFRTLYSLVMMMLTGGYAILTIWNVFSGYIEFDKIGKIKSSTLIPHLILLCYFSSNYIFCFDFLCQNMLWITCYSVARPYATVGKC